MHYTIYKITNNINGKVYIGKHQTKDPNDQYFGSGVALKKAITKHGKHNFTKEVLFIFDNELDMNLKEKELVTEEFISTENTYNIGIGGEGGPHFKGKKHSDETKVKIGAKGSIRRPLSQDARDKISKTHKNKIVSPETREKLKQAALNRFKSQEAKDKISRTMLGRKHTASAKANMSHPKTKKRTLSEEHRAKIAEAAKRRFMKKHCETLELTDTPPLTH